METQLESDLLPEIAHVLLMDVVGYSKLLVDEQIALLQRLNTVVRNTTRFRSAEGEGKLVRVATGDGMALLFFDNPETPLHCALEIAKELKDDAALQLRLGAHSGPIRSVLDVNDRTNVAGAGIDIAQRVLDCGDAGHILLSKRMADDLRAYRHWRDYLQDLGECEVKHGLRLHVFNLCKDGVGNPVLPQKFQEQRRVSGRWWPGAAWRKPALAAALVLASLAIGLGAWRMLHPSGPTPSLPGEKSIAVLPFTNLSLDQENAYFAEGVQDEVLRNLSLIAGLKVISRTSVLHYQAGAVRDSVEIGRTLNVRYLLEGSVQRVGNRVRVITQLVDAPQDAQVWGSRYDRDLADVFAIQSEIAGDIAAQLKAKISPAERAAIQDKPTDNLEAYQSYNHAKWLLDNSAYKPRGQENVAEAVRLLNDAIARDPKFFAAYFQLAHAHDQLYRRFEPTQTHLALAGAAVEKLQALRPDSPETHLARAKHLYWGFLDYAGARAEAEKAQAGLPNDPIPSLIISYIERRNGQWDESLRSIQRALERDPRSVFILNQLSFSYVDLRRYADAAAVLERAAALAPDDTFTQVQRARIPVEAQADLGPLRDVIDHFLATHPGEAAAVAAPALFLALCQRDAARAQRAAADLREDGCYAEGVMLPRSFCEGMAARLAGDEDKAHAAFTASAAESEKTLRAQPDYPSALCALALAHAALGNKDDAIREGRLTTTLLPIKKDAVEGPILIGFLGVIYAWSGEKDLALDQLEAATSVPSEWSYGQLKLHPYFDALRNEPRFQQILARLAPKTP